MRRRILVILSAFLVGALALAAPARAGSFNFSLGTSGTGLAGSVTFSDDGAGNLTIVLSNIGGQIVDPPGVLTALFFNCACGTLTPVSASLTAGSTVLFDTDGPVTTNLGGEWEYLAGISGPGGATQGISSFGGGIFGSPNFNGPNLDGPAAVNGGNYGILSAVDDTSVGNTPVTGGEPLVKNSVTFLLSGFQGSVNSQTFQNISFQYGTSLTEPNLGGGTGGASGQQVVPEPASLILFGSGLSMAAYRARRRKQQKAN